MKQHHMFLEPTQYEYMFAFKWAILLEGFQLQISTIPELPAIAQICMAIGVYSRKNNRIQIEAKHFKEEPMQANFTLLHEMAHWGSHCLGMEHKDRRHNEYIAEYVAMLLWNWQKQLASDIVKKAMHRHEIEIFKLAEIYLNMQAYPEINEKQLKAHGWLIMKWLQARILEAEHIYKETNYV